MKIQKTKIEDIPAVLEIYQDARSYFKENSIPQWQGDYPNEMDIRKDIEEGGSYIAVDQETAVGTCFISLQADHNYDYIENGHWLNDNRYGVLHRTAVHSSCKGRGIADLFVDEAAELARQAGIYDLRADTHEKNRSMRRMLEKNGFKACGIIYVEDGTPRIAYQKQLNSEEKSMNAYAERVLKEYQMKDAGQPEFLQALEEVMNSASLILDKHPEYEKMAVLERLCEPERIIMFKVPWMDDCGTVHVNRGYRVQYSSVLGPYKGGLRFHPTVNLSVLKFLGFEQVFKNCLTSLPIGGGKGGSDFDPKGKSDAEVMRFCQSFMNELYRHIGPDIDVPAGDMGVGGREIGYLYGAYRRLTGTAQRGVLTGKGVGYGGSLARTEATGYGLVYFTEEMLKKAGKKPEGLRAIVSGSGNVAIYACEKAQAIGIKVIAMSDSHGYIEDEELDLSVIKTIKEKERGSLSGYPVRAGHGAYHEGSVYDAGLKCDLALPCATQNEIDLDRAEKLKDGGCFLVAEGANMPDSNEAIAFYHDAHILFAPGKASNAGGVAVSALEMSQNSMRYAWTFEEVDQKLQDIMKNIHRQCIEAMDMYQLDAWDYTAGANLAAMQKIIDAMIVQGIY